MKRGAHIATRGKGVKFRIQGRESRLKKWTCVGWCMCLLTPRYMAYTHDAVTDEAREEVRYNTRYLCFPPVSHHLLRLCSCSCTNASQYTDVTLTSLHPFIKCDGSCAHICIYIQTLAQYQTAVVKVTCLATLGNNIYLSTKWHYKQAINLLPFNTPTLYSGCKNSDLHAVHRGNTHHYWHQRAMLADMFSLATCTSYHTSIILDRIWETKVYFSCKAAKSFSFSQRQVPEGWLPLFLHLLSHMYTPVTKRGSAALLNQLPVVIFSLNKVRTITKLVLAVSFL